MRGRRDLQTTMLAVVDLEERVPPKHPLRVIKQFADRALVELSPVFDEMYGAGGRPSIPPERLLKASLLISLYSVRSERAFCEELDSPPVPLVSGYGLAGVQLRPHGVH
jgi:transposase